VDTKKRNFLIQAENWYSSGGSMDSVYIVMPAYNEEGIIEETIYRWYGVLDGKDEKSRLVVADSESTDKTHEILMRLKLELPQLEILSDTGKQHGPKVMALYDYAIKMGGGGFYFPDRF
jgi:glycosyltransferase involved in cell wall biosynthesis